VHKSIQQYLSRYAEPTIPGAPAQHQWQRVLCIPCFNESSEFINTLPQTSDTLVILVVNHPESHISESNRRFVEALRHSYITLQLDHHNYLLTLEGHNRHALVMDCSTKQKGFNPKHGVGLARKLAADTALNWHASGHITTDWIAMTDADAILPACYFSALTAIHPDTPAVVYPFRHDTPTNGIEQLATCLYELKLHHYVAGLIKAKSPYAHHSIGSCIAVRYRAYAQVRGMPKRAAGEDFYLLNKVRKLGHIQTLPPEATIVLSSRRSARTPFGTGQGVYKLSTSQDPLAQAIFYPSAVFENLQKFIENTAAGAQTIEGLTEGLSQTASDALKALQLEAALDHCTTHGLTPEKFQRQLHQWFDGFRTLKFIHHQAPPQKGLLSFNVWSEQSNYAGISPAEVNEQLSCLCYQNLRDDLED
jgi:hypothetical protein